LLLFKFRGGMGRWGTDSKSHIIAVIRPAGTFEDIVWEIIDVSIGIIGFAILCRRLQHQIGHFFYCYYYYFFLSLNNNGRTGFNVKIVSEVCNSDNNLGCGGSYVQQTIPHLEAVAQSSSSGPDWRLTGESKGNLLLRFSFWIFRYSCQG